MSTRAEAKITTDHDEIQSWAEERGGQPACVKGTGGPDDVGMLRIDFPGYSGEESLQHISWDDWFQKFDERGLALLHQEMTAGGAQSNFNKLVSRETAGQAGQRTEGAHRKRTTARSSTAKKSSAKKSSAKKTAKKPAAKKKSARRAR